MIVSICILQIIGQYTMVDSSGNAYTISSQLPECIAYNQYVDAIQIVNRSYNPTGCVNVHQCPSDQTWWTHDYAVYNNILYGSSLQPTSIASDFGQYDKGPHICHATYTGGIGYRAVATYQTGSWYSSYWDNPADLYIDDARQCIGKQLPNGNLLFIITTGDHSPYPDTIRYCSYSTNLQQPLGNGLVAAGKTLWGFDLNAGIAYVFYYDNSMNVYYKTTTNGINWSSEQSYNLIWPNPYSTSRTDWMQCAVTDQGMPLLVFNRKDYMDVVYPYYSRIYVSYGSGTPCVQVSSTFGAADTECYYPTIATGGNLAAVLYCMPRNNLSDSLNWWDFYITWSHDNGASWTTPHNLTSSFTDRPAFQQLAKRINPNLQCAYYLYALDLRRNIDPYWCFWHGNIINPVAICLGEGYFPAVQEIKQTLPVFCTSVNPNPFRHATKIIISYERHTNQKDLSPGLLPKYAKIFNCSGQVIKDIRSNIAGNKVIFYWDGSDSEQKQVPPGNYFVSIDGNKADDLKLIKLK